MKTKLPHTASDFCVEDEVQQPRKFRTIAQDEFERLVKSTKKELEEALERGRKDRLAAERAFTPPPNSSIRFT